MKNYGRVILGDYIRESKARVSANNPPVLSVTNSSGFKAQQEHFNKSVHSKNISNYKIVRRGQFAYNPSRVNVGSIDLLENYDEGALSPMYVVFNTDENKLLPEYLRYFTLTQSFKSMVKQNTAGTVRESLSFEGLSRFRLFLPSLYSQQKIINTLKIVDKAISKTQSIVNQTQRLKKGLMQDLFSESMKTVLLSETADIQTGIAKNGNISGDDIVEMPYIRVANVQDGRLDLGEIKNIKIRESDIPRYLLKEGDLLLTEGGDKDKLGRGYLWNGEIENCLHQNHIFVVRPQKDILDETYLAYLTQSPYGKKYFLSVATQTTNLASINSTKLKNFPVLLPSLTKQRSISGILMAVDKEIAINEKLKRTQMELKKGLMQDLLSGKVRV